MAANRHHCRIFPSGLGHKGMSTVGTGTPGTRRKPRNKHHAARTLLWHPTACRGRETNSCRYGRRKRNKRGAGRKTGGKYEGSGGKMVSWKPHSEPNHTTTITITTKFETRRRLENPCRKTQSKATEKDTSQGLTGRDGWQGRRSGQGRTGFIHQRA
ncbi:hypothetical protein E2C01_050718 [Portunus trituberculatus]|uniref:Uncharacterized protein n=1 Tax=Portunus trituberculatus TaxID=210409 RepID=A0A5B7GCU9_PORTR|nr:hypothetical protein [Portunus trituberculatus]